MMLHKPEVVVRDQAVETPVHIVALDRGRSVITLLVVLHHSVINYTHFGHSDRMRWLGFDLVVLFNDSFFMACMFFVSGPFVWGRLTRRGDGDLPAEARLAIGCAISGLDLCPDAGCPLSDLSALSFAGNNGLQFLSFLVAHAGDRSLAVRVGVVLVGVAECSTGSPRCCGPWRTERSERARATHLCPARPADDSFRAVPGLLDPHLSADAPDLRCFILAGAGPLSASDSDQPHPCYMPDVSVPASGPESLA
jgi:hypothetical protein